MNQALEITDNVLDSLLCLDENEKDDILQFITTELAMSLTKTDTGTKVSDFRLVRILSFLLLGEKIWDTKTLYNAKDLDTVLELYERAPICVQIRLDDLMEIFKIEIYGSID